MKESRSAAWLIAVCSVSLLLPLLVPLLTGRIFAYDDLGVLHLPMRHLYQHALRAGDSILWTPSLFAGLYLQGEGQAGMFHPLHQVLYRLLPLGPAFNLELIVNYVAAFVGTTWFLRRLRFSLAAALFGAMTFAFCGFNLRHYHHVNLVAVVSHLPWLLGATDMLIAADGRNARTLAFAAVALIVGSECLVGFPQAVWWNAIAFASFAVFRAAGAGRRRQLVPCAAAWTLGVLLGAVQLLPTADAASESIRASVPREFALTISLHPLNLAQVWSPYLFRTDAYSEETGVPLHEFATYSGAILPVALVWCWIRRRALEERRALITGTAVFAAVMLILALGRYGGLAHVLTWVPWLRTLRAPVRFVVLAQFALAILAAVTFEDLAAIREGRREVAGPTMTLLWIPVALGVITTLAVNTGWAAYGGDIYASVGTALRGVAIVAVVTLLVALTARRIQWALVALIVVSAVDLGAWGMEFVYREPARTISELTRGLPTAPDDPADSYASPPVSGPYRGDVLVMLGYRLSRAYVGLFPSTVHPLNSTQSLRLSGTRWYFAADGTRTPAEQGSARARFLDEQGRDTSAVVDLVVDRPGNLVASVDIPARGVLALTERYHRGWSATVDGVARDPVRVNGDFLGCVLDPGVHLVRFAFMPRSFVYGSIVSAGAALLLAGLLVMRSR